MSAATERSTEVGRDLALMGELAARLRNLEQSIERSYGPALRRLAAQNIPGARYALVELDDAVFSGSAPEKIEDLRRAIEGIVYARGDPDRWTFWHLGLERGTLVPGERSDTEVLTEIGQAGGHDADEQYARYLAGKRKATAEHPVSTAASVRREGDR